MTAIRSSRIKIGATETDQQQQIEALQRQLVASKKETQAVKQIARAIPPVP